ncbi:hypothetical protein AAZX31_11G116400 [Glycine max]|nr:hypothetical protein GLYMA_11G118401v4 [Glycine max]KAH1158727.1 hypothetical protein GYH30_030778 [Glycine max]
MLTELNNGTDNNLNEIKMGNKKQKIITIKICKLKPLQKIKKINDLVGARGGRGFASDWVAGGVQWSWRGAARRWEDALLLHFFLPLFSSSLYPFFMGIICFAKLLF